MSIEEFGPKNPQSINGDGNVSQEFPNSNVTIDSSKSDALIYEVEMDDLERYHERSPNDNHHLDCLVPKGYFMSDETGSNDQ